MFSSQRDFLQRLRQTSTPCTPSPPMSAWHRVSVSQHEYALSCAASNAGGFRYTADPLLVGLDQEMMGLFNLARAFVFPALTALSLIETFQKPADQTTDLPSAHFGKSGAGPNSAITNIICGCPFRYIEVTGCLQQPDILHPKLFAKNANIPKMLGKTARHIFFVQANLNFFGRVSISKFA